jgi:hypothetical protein
VITAQEQIIEILKQDVHQFEAAAKRIEELLPQLGCELQEQSTERDAGTGQRCGTQPGDVGRLGAESGRVANPHGLGDEARVTPRHLHPSR